MLECLIELLYNRLSSFRTLHPELRNVRRSVSDMSAQPFGSSEAVNDGPRSLLRFRPCGVQQQSPLPHQSIEGDNLKKAFFNLEQVMRYEHL